MKKLIYLIPFLFSLDIALAQNSELDSLRNELKKIQSKMQIKKSIDSLTSLINQPTVQPVNSTKKGTRLAKIKIEIDSLNELKQNGKYAIFMGLGVQVVAYLSLSSALASDIEINSSGKLANKPTDKGMMYAGLVFGTVLELVGVYNYFESANRLAQVEAKKYDLMEDN